MIIGTIVSISMPIIPAMSVIPVAMMSAITIMPITMVPITTMSLCVLRN
jgi:hypothetical protein